MSAYKRESASIRRTYRSRIGGSFNFPAAATDNSSGQSASASRWLGGGLVALELGWPGRGPLGAIFGAEAARVSGGTAVRLNQLAVAQLPALQWGFQVGLEYRP